MILGGGFPCLPILVGFSHDAKTGGKRNLYLRLTTTADDDAITWLTNYGTVWCIRQQLQLLHTLKHLPWNNNDILLYRQRFGFTIAKVRHSHQHVQYHVKSRGHCIPHVYKSVLGQNVQKNGGTVPHPSAKLLPNYITMCRRIRGLRSTTGSTTGSTTCALIYLMHQFFSMHSQTISRQLLTIQPPRGTRTS